MERIHAVLLQIRICVSICLLLSSDHRLFVIIIQQGRVFGKSTRVAALFNRACLLIGRCVVLLPESVFSLCLGLFGSSAFWIRSSYPQLSFWDQVQLSAKCFHYRTDFSRTYCVCSSLIARWCKLANKGNMESVWTRLSHWLNSALTTDSGSSSNLSLPPESVAWPLYIHRNTLWALLSSVNIFRTRQNPESIRVLIPPEAPI